MALQNPTIDPPRFTLPTKIYSGISLSPSTSPSPSPSRCASPSRHHRNFSHSYDPLARDLSPSRTLKAFASTRGSAESKSEAALIGLIEKASTSERAFGIRIAQICKDIGAWHVELRDWPWGDSFEPPTNALDAPEGPYWGSLAQNQVMAYEQRIRDIREALFDQDVDSLKDYVLAQHTHTASTSYEHLNDFTALITATILRALPGLARLDHLLNTWMIRLAVLRKIPGYLSGLDQAKSELDSAWSDMKTLLDQNRDVPSLHQAFQSLREKLESRMGKVGGRLDSMLDDLEGKEETLPDPWIDSFESLEASYTEWLTETERRINSQPLYPSATPADKTTPAAVTTRDMASATPDTSEREHVDDPSQAAPDLWEPPLTAIHESFQDAESPILGTSPSVFLPDVDEASDLDSDSASYRLDKTRPTLASPSPLASSATSPQRLGSLKSSPSSPLATSRSRHVPIIVDYKNGAPNSPQSQVSEVDSQSSPRVNSRLSSPVIQSEVPTTTNNVRARAALMNGGIETKQMLQKSSSPVRPFEHASAAFTKLFHKANSADDRSRSNSLSIKSTPRPALGLGIKNHDGFRRFHRASSLTSPKKTPDEQALRSYTASPQPVRQFSSPHSSQSRSQSTTNSSPPPTQDDNIGTNSTLPDPSAAYVTPEVQQDFILSTEESRSTVDTTWTSPEVPDFPEDWPLPPVRVVGDEVTTPQNPMSSNTFEQMFVDSLPSTPHDSDKKPRPNSHEDSSDTYRRRSQTTSSSTAPRPRHSKRPSTTSLSFEPISELPTPGSLDATPELKDASAAGYFVAKKVRTPSAEVVQPPNSNRSVSLNRLSSQFDTRDTVQAAASDNGSAVEDDDATLDGSVDGQESDYEVFPPRLPTTMIKRASIASIGNHSRSELTTVDIPNAQRRASSLSRLSFGRLSRSSSPEPMPRSMIPQSVSSLVSPPIFHSDMERSHDGDELGSFKPVPSSLNVPKRRLVVETEPISSPTESEMKTPMATSFKKKHVRKESGAEQIDRHVSRVLSALPSRIAFKPSGSGPSLPETPTASSTPSNSVRGRPVLSTKPARTGLTLSAAQPDSISKKPSVNEADVKVYHLMQEGKEQPIKLFVRLVGEGERVMVRVGGGWADLGEYLRHYAEHHSHRTFSEGKVELAPAAPKVGSMRIGAGTKTRTPLSRPSSVMDRPDSSMSFRTSRSSFGASTFAHESDSSPSSSSQNVEITPTTNRYGYSTPNGSVKSTSRPSTADTSYMHASPSSWSGKDIGLAGPKGKQSTGLDEQKARWVEEMIGRAKQASTEKKKYEDRTAWSEMGKVGGTRRMIFKHNSNDGAGGN